MIEAEQVEEAVGEVPIQLRDQRPPLGACPAARRIQ
jgi:hypothetical protein